MFTRLFVNAYAYVYLYADETIKRNDTELTVLSFFISFWKLLKSVTHCWLHCNSVTEKCIDTRVKLLCSPSRMIKAPIL